MNNNNKMLASHFQVSTITEVQISEQEYRPQGVTGYGWL